MKWLYKIFSFFESRKIKELKLLRKDDIINIYPPEGYTVNINGKKYCDQVMKITLHNNDPISKKVWFYTKVDDNQVSFIKSYKSEIFKDFILLNCGPLETQNKSKEQLKKEMQAAIHNENYELANLINEEIKNLDGQN